MTSCDFHVFVGELPAPESEDSLLLQFIALLYLVLLLPASWYCIFVQRSDTLVGLVRAT